MDKFSTNNKRNFVWWWCSTYKIRYGIQIEIFIINHTHYPFIVMRSRQKHMLFSTWWYRCSPFSMRENESNFHKFHVATLETARIISTKFNPFFFCKWILFHFQVDILIWVAGTFAFSLYLRETKTEIRLYN